jgi:4-aminobutyrate aminotransferase-like enzyme
VQFVRGEGVWLYDAAGDRYLDAYNNVASVGHCHPHVVQAIARQAAVLNTHTRYLHETVLDFAEKLLATFPPQIGPRHVHLHRQRGQRPRVTRRANLYRRQRLHRHRKRLSRRHQRAG